MKSGPPRWAERFLEWYCRPELLEEIQGDLHELFSRAQLHQPAAARWHFVWNVICFFKLRNIRTTRGYTNYHIMFKSYLLTGFRNAARNSITTTINVLGMSLGVGAAITVFIFMDFMWQVDGFHANKDRIYEVTAMVKENNQLKTWGDTPLMLGPSLRAEQPGVAAIARVEFGSAAVRRNDIVFNESVWFVDPAFTQIFSFPEIKGNSQRLDNKTVIVLTRGIAEKYFGESDPIGQNLSLKFSNGAKEEFIIGAVVDIPETSGMRFSILVSMDKFLDLKFKDSYNWSYLTDATFVLLKPGHSVDELTGHMNKYRDLHNHASPEWSIESFDFVALPKLAARCNQITGAIAYTADPSGVWSLGVIAVLLLLLACFNYMNVAVATVTTRLKEIGIRKVIGSRRQEIIVQFLTENFLICTFSLASGALMAYIIFLPGLNTLFPFEIPFAFSSGKTAFLFFFGILIFIGIISGAYPSFYISSFTPITILRGREKFGQRGLFSRILLTTQFVLAFTTIVGSFVFIDNALYLKSKDWGYEHRRNMVVPVADKAQYLALRDRATASQLIESVAGSGEAIGFQNNTISFEHLQQRFQTVSYHIGFDYLETMNLRLKEGRFFQKDIASDTRESVVVNESFVKRMGWAEPLKESFIYDSAKRFVIGVVRDFHYDGFYNPVGPAIFTILPEEGFRYLSLRCAEGRLVEAEAFLKTAWKEISPDDPYQGFLQDSVFENFNRDNNANINLLLFISTITVLLACLGLFGLVSYNITRKLKEFSIRKVFGANIAHIFRLMNRDYLWILLISFSIGAPSGFFLINTLIQHIYPEPKAPSALPFAIAIALMGITVALTVGSQLRRVITENPTETLRSE
jgi:putative ABC transport system permease protein